MAFEQIDLSGALFKNKRKTKPGHPDYTGQAKIEGVGYWVSAWLKETSNGERYMSLAYTAKDDQTNTSVSKPYGSNSKNQNNSDDFDDDIPF